MPHERSYDIDLFQDNERKDKELKSKGKKLKTRTRLKECAKRIAIQILRKI
jgi:hypothetical protein